MKQLVDMNVVISYDKTRRQQSDEINEMIGVNVPLIESVEVVVEKLNEGRKERTLPTSVSGYTLKGCDFLVSNAADVYCAMDSISAEAVEMTVALFDNVLEPIGFEVEERMEDINLELNEMCEEGIISDDDYGELVKSKYYKSLLIDEVYNCRGNLDDLRLMLESLKLEFPTIIYYMGQYQVENEDYDYRLTEEETDIMHKELTENAEWREVKPGMYLWLDKVLR